MNGWSWPLATGVRRWWVPPRRTAYQAPWVRFTSSTSVTYQPQYAVTARPGSMRRTSPGRRSAASPAPYAAQSKRRSGRAVVDGHAAAEVELRAGRRGRPPRTAPSRAPAPPPPAAGPASRPDARWACKPRSRSHGASASAGPGRSRAPRRPCRTARSSAATAPAAATGRFTRSRTSASRRRRGEPAQLAAGTRRGSGRAPAATGNASVQLLGGLARPAEGHPRLRQDLAYVRQLAAGGDLDPVDVGRERAPGSARRGWPWPRRRAPPGRRARIAAAWVRSPARS